MSSEIDEPAEIASMMRKWTVYWIDTSAILDRVMHMKRYQVAKHSLLCITDILHIAYESLFRKLIIFLVQKHLRYFLHQKKFLLCVDFTIAHSL